MEWLRACVVAVLLAAPVFAQTPLSYTIDHWGVDEGLPNNALAALAPSRDGYLWIGTWAGAVRFDGARFTPIAENLPNDHTRALVEDRTGAMWIGSSGGGLVRWRDGAIDRFVPEHGFAGRDVRAVVEDADGRIWAGTEDGISVIEGDTVTTLRTGNGLRDNLIIAMSRGRPGGIWIASATSICATSGRALHCQPLGSIKGRPAAIAQDRAGTLWVGTDAGLFAGGVPVALDSVTALLESSDGGVWIGFGNGDVGLIRDARIERYRVADGLPARGPVVALYEDPEGSLWTASYNGGLTRLKPKRVTMLLDCGRIDGLGSRFNRAGRGRDDLGGDAVRRDRGTARRAVRAAIRGAHEGCLSARTSGDARRLALDRHRQGRPLSMDRPPHGALRHSRRIVRCVDHGALRGSRRPHLDRHRARRPSLVSDGRLSRAYGAADGVATHYLASFAQDRDGRVWIGSNGNGLSVFEGGRFRTLTPAESPPSGSIAGLLVDSRGDLWVGTASHGLFRRRGGTYEPLGVEQGLGDRLVAVILEDRGGTLWIGTARGISRLPRPHIDAVAEGRAASLDPIVVDKSDGMLNTEGSGGGFDPSGLRDRDGRLWFSTIDGIAVIDPESFPLNRVVPKVRVEAVTVQGRPAATRPDGTFEIPAGMSSIDIAYTAFSFIAPSKVRFRHRIAGLDDTWQDVGARRTAYYPRLPPGSYAFEVMASNNDGVWNPAPASARLDVLPFFWERRSVHAAALALLLAATGLTVFMAAHRRARRRLDEMQRERALDRERSRIARDLHDDLGSRLSHIAIMADRAASATNGHAGRRIAMAARDAVRTMDELVWAVNARNDTVESFAYYIARFAEEHVNAAGLRCRLALPPDLPPRPLAANVRRHLFLACKEAVTNAVKHAHASEIHLGLEVDGRRLVVEIRDDGQGLLPNAMDPTGNGLKNLRERMDAAGGTLTIDSTQGRGTRLIFITPL